MIKTEFVTEYPIREMWQSAQATMGKEVTAYPKNIFAFARNMLVAEHSLLGIPVLKITDTECRSDVISHLVRHTHGRPRHFVQSKRPDWTGEERPKDPAAPRIYVSYWPIDAFMYMARQRLCLRAMAETNKWVKDVRKALSCTIGNADQITLAMALAEVMVPPCVYRSGCGEGIKTCGLWDKIHKDYTKLSPRDRYFLYYYGEVQRESV